MNRRLAQRGDLAELLVRRPAARPAPKPTPAAEPVPAEVADQIGPSDGPATVAPKSPAPVSSTGTAEPEPPGSAATVADRSLAEPGSPGPVAAGSTAGPGRRRQLGWRAVVALAAALVTVAATTAIALAPPVQDWVNDALDRGPAPAPSAPLTPRPVTAPTFQASPSAPTALAPTGALRVEVPAIGVKSNLDKLALDPAGVLLPPNTAARAGWYAKGTVPGQPGPAVIAGHVDSRAGPGVFFKLRLLKPGALIVVGLSGGTSVRFQVTAVRTYPKDKFPTLEVYGPTPGPELRLITCGGDFDRQASSYLDNVVAFAVPV